MKESKTYLKYLPAEGEIKRGDYNVQNDYSTRSSGKSVVGIWEGDEPPVNNQFMKFHRVERFAVTTDIEIGDEVYSMMTNKMVGVTKKKEETGWIMEDGTYWDIDGSTAYVKKLAPISPHVKWDIQDGAEIEIELGYDKWHKLLVKEGESPFEPVTCKVKGPCGHYH